MRTSFLASPEDLAWLRDTFPEVRKWIFACAIIEGNEDCPQRITLAERNHYQSVAVTLDRIEDEDDGDGRTRYSASIGKLG